MTPDILISEAVAGAALDLLASQGQVALHEDLWKSPEELKAALSQARALVVRNQTMVNKEILAAAPCLEVVGRCGAGLDNIDVTAASELGVVVVSTPDQNSLSVAELTLGLMFACARKISAAALDTRSGGWARGRFTGSELYGKTLGIIGLGRIGFLAAMRARAMGMRIVAYDAFISPDAPAVVETQAELVDLDFLLATSDFVSCHTPLTPETRGMLDYGHFSRMKPSAWFLNLARGEIVKEAGLIQALKERRLAGAALDVRETEPPASDELETMENVILTPHIAAFTVEAQERVVRAVCEDIHRVLSGKPARNYVNFPQPRKVAGGGSHESSKENGLIL